MIRYALICNEGHHFESWFKSAAAFDALAAAGHLSCASCGCSDVRKALMAPPVTPSATATATPPTTDQTAREDAVASVRKHVEENATYVGGDFARQARDMHEGTSPQTSIYGEANASEAKSLIEDGVPVLPLPFKPRQKLQ